MFWTCIIWYLPWKISFVVFDVKRMFLVIFPTLLHVPILLFLNRKEHKLLSNCYLKSTCNTVLNLLWYLYVQVDHYPIFFSHCQGYNKIIEFVFFIIWKHGQCFHTSFFNMNMNWINVFSMILKRCCVVYGRPLHP